MVAAALVLVVASGAGATSYLELNFANCGPTETADLWANYPGGYMGNVYTGVYNLHINTAPGSYSGSDAAAIVGQAGASGNVPSFCMDVNQEAPQTAGFQPYQIVPLEQAPIGGANPGGMSAEKADDLRLLFGKYYTTALAGGPDAAAFEACVWEIVSEQSGTYDVDAGTLQVHPTSGGSWDTLANSWLADLGTTPSSNVFALVSEDYQDYAVVIPPQVGAPPVPEPVTAAGVLIALGGLVRYVRRRVN
jgi:hypothetical protein